MKVNVYTKIDYVETSVNVKSCETAIPGLLLNNDVVLVLPFRLCSHLPYYLWLLSITQAIYCRI
jgi:hypothetical protein